MRSQRNWWCGAALGVFTILVAGSAARGRGAQRLTTSGTQTQQSGSPVYFEQASTEKNPIRYSAQGARYDIYVSREEADIVLHGGLQRPEELARGKTVVVRAYANVLRMRFVDANPPTSVDPIERRRGTRSYTSVVYRGIYPGTDVALRGDQRRIGFELNLSPGADARQAALEIAGATSIKLDEAGDAVVSAGHDSLVLERPLIRIRGNGRAQFASGAYRIDSGNRLRFVTGTSSPGSNQMITD